MRKKKRRPIMAIKFSKTDDLDKLFEEFDRFLSFTEDLRLTI